MSSQSPNPTVPGSQGRPQAGQQGARTTPAATTSPHGQSEPRNIADLVTSAVGDISNIVTSQVELAKAELRQSAQRGAAAVALGAAALVLGFLALVFLLITLAYVLVQLGLPTWAGFGIVTVLLIIAVAILGSVASKKIKGITGPEKTIAEIETTKSELVAAVMPTTPPAATSPTVPTTPTAPATPKAPNTTKPPTAGAGTAQSSAPSTPPVAPVIKPIPADLAPNRPKDNS